MVSIEQLKNDTKIGDKYRWFYSDGILTGKLVYGVRDSGITKTITRVSKKSVWLNGKDRISWNTLLDYINKTVYQKEV